jgi:aryl-alcohol dehydrogenase-like predicted oxidoreductase
MAPARELLGVCEEHDLAAVARSPLNGGILTGKFTATSTFPPDDERHGLDFSQGHFASRLRQVETMRSAMTQDGRSFTQGALGWILSMSDRTIPIPGFKTVRQVEELARSASLPPFTDDQIARVAAFQDDL